ncbi:MAG: DUF393 domain-containing protein [Pseudomonadota bacterium]
MPTEDHRSKSTEVKTPVLYYDGQCPLCAGEISALAQRRGSALCLVDVHSLPKEGLRNNGEHLSKEALLKTLHLQTSQGKWLTGADANVHMWDGTRRGKMLTVLRWPLLRHLVDMVYGIWAEIRYRRLYAQSVPESAKAPEAAPSGVIQDPEHRG